MSEPTMETVHEFANQLRQYATHFTPRDWEYTRHHNVRRIRIAGEWSGYEHPLRRTGRFLSAYLQRGDDWLAKTGREIAWRHPFIHARVTLGTDRHLPDGTLDNGAIITHWEETGEYLQYVQPSVGSMLADWMDAEPDSPHALRIAAEMRRINQAYGERIERGE